MNTIRTEACPGCTGTKGSVGKDFIMPIIGLILSPSGLGNLASEKATFAKEDFLCGDFLVALITFIIVAFVIFLLVNITKKWGIE